MSYNECKNCLTGYEISLQKCPICLMSKDTSDGAIVLFDDFCRTEISKLGGIIMEFIVLQDGDIVVPCEWGVVCCNTISGLIWSAFVGLVHDVSVNENKILINLSDKIVIFDGLTGKAIRATD